MSRRLTLALALTCLGTLSGCGSAPPAKDPTAAEATPAGNFYIGKQAVYAHLVQGSGGSWILKTITDSDANPDKGYLVRLNDLAPSFDTRVAECQPQAYPDNHKCNPLQPFRDKNVGVMGKIISGGIAAGTAGKVTEISRTYKTAFDTAAFNQAVDEALVNTGLNDQRRAFIASLERYDALFESGSSELAGLKDEALSRYRNTDAVALDIRPRITGLTDYYSDDIDFRRLVSVVPAAAPAPGSGVLERQSILPCPANRCVSIAKEAMETLGASIHRERRSLEATLAEETAEYALVCDASSHAGYSFVLDCPESLPVSAGGTATVPVTLRILSRDFDALYPRFDIDDENLSVAVDGELVRFRNLTHSYLSVSALTIYYNSQVQTHSERIDIAPGVTVERPIDAFVTPAIRIEASYRRMTPDKANGASFKFGFAARYRLAGESEDTTLYDLRSFNVGCVIDERVRPGSCRYATESSAGESAPADR